MVIGLLGLGLVPAAIMTMDVSSLVRTMRPDISPMRFARRPQSAGGLESGLTTETKRFWRPERQLPPVAAPARFVY